MAVLLTHPAPARQRPLFLGKAAGEKKPEA